MSQQIETCNKIVNYAKTSEDPFDTFKTKIARDLKVTDPTENKNLSEFLVPSSSDRGLCIWASRSIVQKLLVNQFPESNPFNIDTKINYLKKVFIVQHIVKNTINTYEISGMLWLRMMGFLGYLICLQTKHGQDLNKLLETNFFSETDTRLIEEYNARLPTKYISKRMGWTNKKIIFDLDLAKQFTDGRNIMFIDSNYNGDNNMINQLQKLDKHRSVPLIDRPILPDPEPALAIAAANGVKLSGVNKYIESQRIKMTPLNKFIYLFKESIEKLDLSRQSSHQIVYKNLYGNEIYGLYILRKMIDYGRRYATIIKYITIGTKTYSVKTEKDDLLQIEDSDTDKKNFYLEQIAKQILIELHAQKLLPGLIDRIDSAKHVFTSNRIKGDIINNIKLTYTYDVKQLQNEIINLLKNKTHNNNNTTYPNIIVAVVNNSEIVW